MYYLVFILGIVIGSFLNVCIYRIPRGESIAYPPSHCTNCGKRLKPYDLIPVLSYIFLRGKCRSCGSKISIKYPLIEAVTGILFLLVYIKYGISIETIKYWFLLSHLIVIGLIDFSTMDIYLNTILSGIIFALIFIGYNIYTGGVYVDNIFGAVLGGGFILLVILLSGGGMGFGDAEICFMCGLYFGLKLSAAFLFFSVIIGGIAGVILILSGRKKAKQPIPFGPSITLGGLITILYGEEIINWYIGFLA